MLLTWLRSTSSFRLCQFKSCNPSLPLHFIRSFDVKCLCAAIGDDKCTRIFCIYKRSMKTYCATTRMRHLRLVSDRKQRDILIFLTTSSNSKHISAMVSQKCVQEVSLLWCHVPQNASQHFKQSWCLDLQGQAIQVLGHTSNYKRKYAILWQDNTTVLTTSHFQHHRWTWYSKIPIFNAVQRFITLPHSSCHDKDSLHPLGNY